MGSGPKLNVGERGSVLHRARPLAFPSVADARYLPSYALMLAGLTIRMQKLRTTIQRGELTDADQLANRVQVDLRTEIRTLRQMMSSLRPPVLDERGLPAALEELSMAIERSSGIPCRVQATVATRVEPAVETVLYRVAQEALANVVKHAKAGNVWVSVLAVDDRLMLQVRDDGVGFDPSANGSSTGVEHFGLIAMRERVEMAGGALEVRSAPGMGTTLHASVPAGVVPREAGAPPPG